MLFILAGLGKLAINWGTGQWSFTILALQIPCASAIKPLYQPWIIAAYLPVGAMLFLNERWRDKILGRV
jgi:TRAP-type C4-dicarboxylate transport system permease small subunit